jgi:hypothetical protein
MSAQPSSPTGRRSPWPRLLLILAAIVAVALVLSGRLVDWLWMGALGYESVFWTILTTRIGLFAAAFVPVFAYFWVNLRLLARRADTETLLRRGAAQLEDLSRDRIDQEIVRRVEGVRRFAPWLALIPAAIAGWALAGAWETYARFAAGGAFGRTDPIYGLDVGFYVFTLPFLHLVEALVAATVLAGTIIVGLGYLYAGTLGRDAQGRLRGGRGALVHLAVNLCILVATLIFGQWLSRYDLLVEPSGTVFGAGYTDVHFVRWALWAAMAAGVALIGGFLWVAFDARRPAHGAIAAAGYVLVLALALVIVPGLFQRFVVEPNELELEAPYLRHNIAFTRQAYGLAEIDERSYDPQPTLTLADIRAAEPTIDNIRLWDWRPIGQTFRQLQQIRAYYEFRDVDIDRYRFDGEYRQVLLSGREMAQSVPARAADTWVNRHLQYTHGYGLVMAPSAEVAPNGRPELVVRDLPPVSPEGLPIEQPAIHYGEGQTGYRVVTTGLDEFDYPRGDENVYTQYHGRGGVGLGSGWRRALFAWEMGDVSILLSDYIGEDSLIQFRRPLQQRIERIAPFLRLDTDPYLVVSDGRLFWIQDAYTTSLTYPYSEIGADRDFNYVRNSVKIVVDAYHGDVDFYVVDPDDPVIGAYRSYFPELFQPLDAMPAGLRDHLRYPVDLFDVQIDMYSTYHMTVPQVFYNREDVWTVPSEKYAGEPIEMEPYYVLIRLPGADRVEFLLMQPLTPVNRDNMIAWVAARADAPHYGELVAFRLPKERLILGPIQIEAMIDQDTRISRQLSLWDQRGSRVTRGNLLVIPIDRSFLYVEPVYLRAEDTDIPQLQRVIVSDGERLAMQPTLDRALRAVFGEAPRVAGAAAEAAAAPAAAPTPVQMQVIERARDTLAEARQALQQGDWTTFGERMDALRDALSEQPSTEGEAAGPAEAETPETN